MGNDATANAPSWLEQLRANPRLPLMIGASAAVAGIAALWLWSRASDYGVLYSNLSDCDGGAIIASLQQMNIAYKFSEGGGALLVAANRVPEARLRLPAQGLPKGGTVGFELLDNQKFGTSQFAEQIGLGRITQLTAQPAAQLALVGRPGGGQAVHGSWSQDISWGLTSKKFPFSSHILRDRKIKRLLVRVPILRGDKS